MAISMYVFIYIDSRADVLHFVLIVCVSIS